MGRGLCGLVGGFGAFGGLRGLPGEVAVLGHVACAFEEAREEDQEKEDGEKEEEHDAPAGSETKGTGEGVSARLEWLGEGGGAQRGEKGFVGVRLVHAGLLCLLIFGKYVKRCRIVP